MTKHQKAAPDLARVRQRISERCQQLGLSEEEVAARAGMAPTYLRYLTEVGPGFDEVGVLRVAAALGLTYQELMEGRHDAPPGQDAAVARPALVNLTEPECWAKLGTHGVGRIALAVEPGPAVLPVNYLVDGETVVYRTSPAGTAAVESGTHLSFEADQVDDQLRHGWSVLLVGTGEQVGDPETVQVLERRSGAEPWVGGEERRLWIRVRPDRVSGRRIGSVTAEGHLE
ncbi:helix-turn-helix domain-containing protein [Kitasatospora azatica]|uniref:helix-turn-helix domain-containing protein n=1 Tax=Kitasatospora azatica TaxID=58347 RepID=UPI00068EE7B8|nr:pyridoxamine 5'-phosphate oxidase family protein [Kitasatospora azatica]